MATNKLALYNIALMAIGDSTISALTEATEARRVLDEVWDRGGGAVKYFLEQGLWNHAMRAVKIVASTSVVPEFGFTYAFDIPTDFVRLDQISAGEKFNMPLTDYEFEGAYIYAEVDPIYMRYVSDGQTYGNDLSLWPNSFTLWAGVWLATQIAPKLKGDLDIERLEKREKRLLQEARSKDMSQEPTRFSPPGRWVMARHGGRIRGDRGKRSVLIG